MALEQKIQQDIMAAMKAHDNVRTNAVRAIKSAILLAKTAGQGDGRRLQAALRPGRRANAVHHCPSAARPGMKLREVIAALEHLAPLRLQDEWDNSGLQVGFPESEIDQVLVCLDVTEAIVDEAIAAECNLIVSHHPLIFKALRQVSDATYQQRCVVKALAAGISIYSAHTSLDNAPGGVNHRIAALLGLEKLRWLSPRDGEDAGSGLVGELPASEPDAAFLARVQRTFGVECLQHSALDGRQVRRVALCGGAGAFLLHDAVCAGADCFISGEFHYHDYFENQGVLLAELGHYQSEQFTQDLLLEYLHKTCPGLTVRKTAINTNPICYDQSAR